MNRVFNKVGIFKGVTNPVFPFTPARIFSSGGIGAWFDPSDKSTVFSDRTGSTTASIGGPIGLVLDKSQATLIGPEVLINGDFEDGSTGWTVTGTDGTHIATFSGGTMRYQSDTTSPQLNVTPTGALTVGKTYLVEIVTSAYTSGILKIDQFSGAIFFASAIGASKFRVVASSPFLTISRGSANVDVTIDSISVNEIPGEHAIQATSANIPIYAGGNSIQNVSIDSLNWTAPAGSYTIAYLGSSGPVILDGQALSGATDIMVSSRIYEYVAVDRQLSSSERRQLLQYLNDKSASL